MTMYFDVNNPPAVGSRVVLDRKKAVGSAEYEVLQTYHVTSAVPARKKSGLSTVHITWKSRCTDCGAAFKFTKGVEVNFYRRCQPCRKANAKAGIRTSIWNNGPKNRFTYHPAEVDVDPASLF